MPPFAIRATEPADRPWVAGVLTDAFAAPAQFMLGRLVRPDEMPGFIAEWDGDRVGFIAYLAEADGCDITALVSLEENQGIGAALLAAVVDAAKAAGSRRLRITTTNDNTRALRLFQRRGFRLVAVHPNAMEEGRKLKPEIPLAGNDGIPLRDELELEMNL